MFYVLIFFKNAKPHKSLNGGIDFSTEADIHGQLNEAHAYLK